MACVHVMFNFTILRNSSLEFPMFLPFDPSVCSAGHPIVSMMRVNVLRQSVLVSQKWRRWWKRTRWKRRRNPCVTFARPCQVVSSLICPIFTLFTLRQFKIYIFIIVGVGELGKWENSTSEASHVCWRRIHIKVNGGGRKRGQKRERVELKNIFINPQNSSSLLGCCQILFNSSSHSRSLQCCQLRNFQHVQVLASIR